MSHIRFQRGSSKNLRQLARREPTQKIKLKKAILGNGVAFDKICIVRAARPYMRNTVRITNDAYRLR
jgi:hypothetical protein